MTKAKKFSLIIRIATLIILCYIFLNGEEAPEIYIQKGHTLTITSVAISRGGEYIVSGGDDNTVRLWEVKTGKEVRTFKGHTGPISSVALSGDNQILASGSNDTTVRLWNVKTGREIRKLEGHKVCMDYLGKKKKGVSSVALSWDGQILASGGWDNTVRLWDVKTGKEIRSFRDLGTVRENDQMLRKKIGKKSSIHALPGKFVPVLFHECFHH